MSLVQRMDIRESITTPRGVVLMAALAIIAVNVGFGQIVLKDQERQKAVLRAEVSEARRAVNRPGVSVAKAAEGVETFKAGIPDRGGLTGVLNDIFDTALNNGLNITSGDYSPQTVKETDIFKYTIRFPVEGTYPKLKRFIYDIETLPHILAVEEIAFTSATSGSKIGLDITISTYFL